ncbi:MAG TPA: KEOPS complex subunit Pcc1 [Candidatus Thermoplasmatota archaeon]|nr:KEOPS complex subunit Pcc1 [Candidatus Thermoplasmatota archaeon]
MLATAVLVLEAGAFAAAVEGALAPEATEPILRGRATLRRDGGAVVVTLEADDVVALRAAVNSYLRAAVAIGGALRAAER